MMLMLYTHLLEFLVNRQSYVDPQLFAGKPALGSIDFERD